MDVLDVESYEYPATGNLDWCNAGQHGPSSTSRGCPGVLHPTKWPDPARRGSFYTSPGRACACPCHTRSIILT